MAYVLGFFAADGYITVNKRGGQFWCIQITDEALLLKIRRIIGSEHKINVRKGIGNNKELFRMQIGSIEMCNDLRKLGFNERKTNSLAAPNVPTDLFSDFVRGYFDGDGNVWIGYVHKERVKKLRTIRTIFTSCSEGFLNILRCRLEEDGIEKGVIRKGDGGYFRLTYSIHGSLKLYDFMYNSHIQRNGLFLERKKSVFEKYVSLRL